jgi:hypothetical protein
MITQAAAGQRELLRPLLEPSETNNAVQASVTLYITESFELRILGRAAVIV